MAASTVEVPVFTETNLGTRIAMAVPPDITARDFKSEQKISHPLSSFCQLLFFSPHLQLKISSLCQSVMYPLFILSILSCILKYNN